MRLESRETIYVLRSPGPGGRFIEGTCFRWRTLLLVPRIGLFTFKTTTGGIIRAYRNEIFNRKYKISNNPFSTDVFDSDEKPYQLHQPQAFKINKN